MNRMHMKRITALRSFLKLKNFWPLLMLVLCFGLSGCSFSLDKKTYSLPESYTESMREIVSRLEDLESYLVGGDFEKAEVEAFVLENITTGLVTKEPSQALAKREEYEDYQNQVDDLTYANMWLLYYIRHRDQASSEKKLVSYLKRFHRFSDTYGAGGGLPVSRLFEKTHHQKETLLEEGEALDYVYP